MGPGTAVGPSAITMAVTLPTPTELARWDLADLLAFAQVGHLPLGQLEGLEANRSHSSRRPQRSRPRSTATTPTISQTPRSPRMMCSASKMPGLKGVLASEARPAGTDVSRPEATVLPD